MFSKHQISFESRLSRLGKKRGISFFSGTTRMLYGTPRIISGLVSTYFYAYILESSRDPVTQFYVNTSLVNSKFGFFLGDLINQYATMNGKFFIVLLNADQQSLIDV